MLDIELGFVCPPYLHILLGILNKHHELLEEAADEIDMNIFNSSAASDNNVVKNVVKYGKNWKQALDLEQKINTFGTITETETEEEKIICRFCCNNLKLSVYI